MSTGGSAPTSNVDSNPIRNKTQEIMSILFDKKEIMGDGDYLKCSDLLKEIHDESSNRAIRIRITPEQSMVELEREMRLRTQVLEERENMVALIRELMTLTNRAVRHRQSTIPVNALVALIRNATHQSDDEETDSDSDSDSDDETDVEAT